MPPLPCSRLQLIPRCRRGLCPAVSPGEDGYNGVGGDKMPKGLHPVSVDELRRYLIAEELVG